jgi:hypothetical protein
VIPFEPSSDNLKVLARLRAAWPLGEELKALEKTDLSTHTALHQFRLAFFRDEKPLFDIILQSKSRDSVVFYFAEIQMTDILVERWVPVKGLIHGGTLDAAAEYNWRVSPFDDPMFDAWVKKKSSSVDPWKAYYREVAKLRFELDPPLVVPAGEPARLRVRFHNNPSRDPCKLRFVFLYGQGKRVASPWYDWQPTESVRKK